MKAMKETIGVMGLGCVVKSASRVVGQNMKKASVIALESTVSHIY